MVGYFILGDEMKMHDIDIPLNLDTEFVTPMWRELEEYYPKYKSMYTSLHKRNYSFNEYHLDICIILNGHRNRSTMDWFGRYLDHFGFKHFNNLCDRWE